MFMTEVFNKLTDIPSFHEPEPTCKGETIKCVNDGGAYPNMVRQELTEKLAQVRRDTKNGYYFESSQMFIKVYAELMLDAFDDVYCIYIYRNPLEVLASYCKKRPERWNDWFLQSHWPKNILWIPKEELSFYENCLWQWFEVRRRYYSLKNRFKKTYEFDFAKINSVEEWKRFFRTFGIKHKDFKKVPDVGKNEIEVDFEEVVKFMAENWDKPGTIPPPGESEYSIKESFIKMGQRLLDSNEEEMSHNEIR